MKKLFILTLFGMSSQLSYAQEFSADLQLRPRVEYRHGYQSLIADSAEATTFVSQRSRINFKYKSDQLDALISFQNVRVWGDVGTLSARDVYGTAIHEAWAIVKLNSKFQLKMGRQEIDHDDSRIFGNVDWVQTGRSHDAFITTFQANSKNKIELGLALNEANEALVKVPYNVGNYKSFQYLRYHTTTDQLKLSLLALNTGFTYDNNGKQAVSYSQTFGTHFAYGQKKIKTDASAYYQTGKIANRFLNAYNFALNVKYKLHANFTLGVGGELLSGTDMNTTSSELKSFNPLFGTNHKFNGALDYFYVGNHINSVGLLDLNLNLKYQKEKISFELVPHVFSSAAVVVDNLGNKKENYLGTELDFTFGYKLADNIDFKAGYSHLFASESLQVLKGGNENNMTNWAWAMFVFKPNLFSHTKVVQSPEVN